MEVPADARANRADDLEQKARAVLQRPTVFVGSIVDARGEKLREQVAVGGVQLDSVKAGFLRAPSAGSKGLHEVIDLGLAGRTAEKPVQRSLAARRAQRRTVGIMHAWKIHLPAGMAELHDVLAVELMHRRAEPLPQRDEIVAVNRGVVGDDASLH